MFLALGCARGLRALHRFSPDLCHRDIKSSNFLVDGQLNAKICDLELGGVKNHGLDIHKDGILCTWQAPEVMRSQPATQASDIYSLGLVLWELVSGKVPFAEYGRDSDQLMYQVRQITVLSLVIYILSIRKTGPPRSTPGHHSLHAH